MARRWSTRGGLLGSEHEFILDSHHVMEKGRMFPVCGNTYRMLIETRFSDYFEFYEKTECKILNQDCVP